MILPLQHLTWSINLDKILSTSSEQLIQRYRQRLVPIVVVPNASRGLLIGWIELEDRLSSLSVLRILRFSVELSEGKKTIEEVPMSFQVGAPVSNFDTRSSSFNLISFLFFFGTIESKRQLLARL